VKRALLVLALTGCGAPSSSHEASEALRACAAKAGHVETIAAVVDHVNALPLPVDAACFVASLPRPLEVVATTNTVSAQPAVGPSNPRILLLTPGIVFSVAPGGDGADLLELGEWTSPTRTLMGEIGLPVSKPLDAREPYEHTLWDSYSTTCSRCHSDEKASHVVGGAFESIAYQPRPETLVDVDTLGELHDRCEEKGDTSARCALLHAIFDLGEVKDGEFSAEVATF
jgi:hypothetical protein